MRVGILAQKLAFARDSRQAGVSRYIEHLLRCLPDALNGDDVLALTGEQAREGPGLDALPAMLSFHWTRWPTSSVPVRIAWEQLAVPLLSRRLALDIVHGPVHVVPLSGRTPSVVTVHDLAYLLFPECYSLAQRCYIGSVTRASVRKARRVIVVSEHTGRDVAERLGVPAEKITIVPNGVGSEFFPRSGAEIESFRAAHQLPATFILFVGTLQPRKNLLGLMRAYAALRPEDRVPLYVVGAPGWMYADIFDEAAWLGIADSVVFPGYVSPATLPLWYSAATAFVYPSFYEGFGLPVLEAMACGTAVITSNVSSLPEVAGDAALLVKPDETEQLADAMLRVLGDEQCRAEMACRGLHRASRFSWERMARETASVYRDVADGA